MKTPQAMRDLVQTAMDAILVRHDADEVRKYFHPDFVQHNPWAADGGAHVEEMCAFEFGVEMRRWFVQGDIVGYHGYYTAPNPLGEHPLVCVDLWRVVGDRIVEHWDVLQPTPSDVVEQLVGGGGDGLADLEHDRVAAQSARVRRLLEVGYGHRDQELLRGVLREDLTLHRSDIEGQGRDAVVAWLQAEEPTFEVRRTVASGDLVLAQVARGTRGKEEVAYEIFRFDEHGRVAENWCTAQDRLPLAEAANPHPHF